MTHDPYADRIEGGAFVTKGGDVPERFHTGSQRDSDSGRGMPELISPFMEARLAQLMERGAEKRGARNWEMGFPFGRTLRSLKRHVNAYQRGDRVEDHLAAIVFNAMVLIHQEEMIAAGRMPAALDDLPRYA